MATRAHTVQKRRFAHAQWHFSLHKGSNFCCRRTCPVSPFGTATATATVTRWPPDKRKENSTKVSHLLRPALLPGAINSANVTAPSTETCREYRGTATFLLTAKRKSYSDSIALYSASNMMTHLLYSASRPLPAPLRALYTNQPAPASPYPSPARGPDPCPLHGPPFGTFDTKKKK